MTVSRKMLLFSTTLWLMEKKIYLRKNLISFNLIYTKDRDGQIQIHMLRKNYLTNKHKFYLIKQKNKNKIS